MEEDEVRKLTKIHKKQKEKIMMLMLKYDSLKYKMNGTYNRLKTDLALIKIHEIINRKSEDDQWNE